MDQHLNFQHSFWDVIQEITYHCFWTITSVGVILCDKRILLEIGLPYTLKSPQINSSYTRISPRYLQTEIRSQTWRATSFRDNIYMACIVCICISVLMNYDCIQLIQFCPSIQLLLSLFQNIALKGYLTQRWMAITVSISQKNFLTKCTS